MNQRKGILPLAALVVILGALVVLVACSGGNNPAPATVNVSLSDPAPCAAASSGPYDAVYITISDVKIHTSTTAGPNDPGWIDLASTLTKAPMQVNLVGQANPQCILAMLGSQTSLQAGTYQQIRVMLLDNTAANASALANNQCGSTAVNCAFLHGSSTPIPLLLSSQLQNGIKIPSGQIAGGQFTIAAGETKDLNIDVDCCASIVVDQGSGQYRLKPVLHAGEVSLQSAINGKLVDASGQPIAGLKAIVALEQIPTSGGTVKRTVMQISPDSTGAFNFCPVSPGTYDVVAVAVNGSNVAYAPAVITGVPAGTSLGNIRMVASVAPGTPGSITGLVTTTATPAAAIAQDVTLSALQPAGASGSMYTIPLALQASPTATANVNTKAGTCPANTDCASYTLALPGVTPTVVAFSTGTPIDLSTDTTGNKAPAKYTVEAVANCSAPGTAAVSLLPNDSLNGPPAVPDINLAGCVSQ